MRGKLQIRGIDMRVNRDNKEKSKDEKIKKKKRKDKKVEMIFFRMTRLFEGNETAVCSYM